MDYKNIFFIIKLTKGSLITLCARLYRLRSKLFCYNLDMLLSMLKLNQIIF